MKALTITNEAVTREALLEMAEKIPGAWIGIRIAALLLLLEGWKSSQSGQPLCPNPLERREMDPRGKREGNSGSRQRNSRDVPAVLTNRFRRLWRTTWKRAPRHWV